MIDPAKPRPELAALTSLRGLAAMAVVLQHFSATAQLNAAGWIPSLVPHGYMAVDFFFVLSGFIMSYTYLAGFEQLGLRAYGPFLWKRVARIFPLGIAVTCIILVCGAVATLFGVGWLFVTVKESGGLPAMLVINLLHLQGFFPDYNMNDPSWSVSVELGAYVLFPALIYLTFRAPPVVTVLGVLVGIAALLRISHFDPTGGLAYRWPPFDLARCVVEFSFGMLIYRAYRGQSVLKRLGQDGWTWLIAAASALALVVRSDLFAAATFPFLVLAFALNRGRPGQVLSHRWVHYLGVISFSIYLMHNMFRVPEFWVVRLLHPAPLSPTLALTVALFGSLSILPFAALAYHCIERPGRDALNSVVKRLNTRAPVRPVPAGPAE